MKRLLWVVAALLLVVGPEPSIPPGPPVPEAQPVVEEASVLSPAPRAGLLPIFFFQGRTASGQPMLHAVYRPAGSGTPRHAIELLLQGPTAEERRHALWTAVPAGARLLRMVGGDEEVIVDLSDAGAADAAPRAAAQVAATLDAFPEVQAVRVCANHRAVRAVLRSQFLHPALGSRLGLRLPRGGGEGLPPAAPPPSPGSGREWTVREARATERSRPPRQMALAGGLSLSRDRPQPPAARGVPEAPGASGPLAGKVIVINGGHGMTRFASGQWKYQRAYFGGVVEDEVNARFAIQAARELRRLGARVYLTRAGVIDGETGVSGAPRWAEAAKYHLRDIGVPDWVYQALPLDFSADIDSRPLYANYLGADLLISLHNNDGANSGTTTLYDTSNGFRGESCRLSLLLQRHIVAEIRSGLGIGWSSLGAMGSNARYGENHWAHMPSALVEIGFMNRRRDRRWIDSELFRQAVARGVGEAVAEYFGVSLPPERGPQPPDTIDPVVALRPARPSVLACLGDPSGSEDAVSAALLQSRLDEHGGRRGRLRVIAAARGSETVEAMLARWDRSVARQRPAYVLIAAGRNDLVKDASGAPRVPLERFEGSLTELVRRTRALGALPSLATIPPIADEQFYRRHPRAQYAADGGVGGLRDRYNAAIRRVARATHSPLADVSRAAWQQERDWLPPASGFDATGPGLSPVGLDRMVSVLVQSLPF